MHKKLTSLSRTEAGFSVNHKKLTSVSQTEAGFSVKA
jgi:hypothetical protein